MAAQRSRVLLAIFAALDNGEHYADWVDEDELDLTGISIPIMLKRMVNRHASCLNNYMSSPWVKED